MIIKCIYLEDTNYSLPFFSSYHFQTFEEQKLIYSGQLLNDAHILKDVLRRFEGQETHTVHLVYTPKNRQQQQSYGTKSSQSVRKDNSNQQSRSQTSQNTQQSRNATTTASDGLR